MKSRYRLIRRACRGNQFYLVDRTSGKRISLNTSDEEVANRLLHARNEAERQPMLNLHLARAYLAGTHSGVASRTWRQAIHSIIETKNGANQERWQTLVRCEPGGKLPEDGEEPGLLVLHC